MDPTLALFAGIILFAYVFLYLSGKMYIPEGFSSMPIKNNVPPEPRHF
jgi:hypothetical protein